MPAAHRRIANAQVEHLVFDKLLQLAVHPGLQAPALSLAGRGINFRQPLRELWLKFLPALVQQAQHRLFDQTFHQVFGSVMRAGGFTLVRALGKVHFALLQNFIVWLSLSQSRR